MILRADASPMNNDPEPAQMSLPAVEAAPFLSELEFEAACDSLVEKYQDGGWNEDSLGLHIQVRPISKPERF